MITVGVIIDAVSEHYNINPMAIRSGRRTDAVRIPRFMACYLAREMTQHSLPAIGRLIGNRDHTTILHAIRKFEEMLRTNEAVQADLECVERSLDLIARTMTTIRMTPQKDLDPLEIAQKIIKSGDCVLVSHDAIQALACSVIASSSEPEDEPDEEKPIASLQFNHGQSIDLLLRHVGAYIAARNARVAGIYAPNAKLLAAAEAEAFMALKSAFEITKIQQPTPQKQEAIHA